MKKFTKTCLIIAAIMAVLGLSLGIAGLVLGVSREDLQRASLNWDLHRRKIVVSENDLKDVEEEFDDVEKLHVEVTAGDVTIEESDVAKVNVVGNRVYTTFECRMDGKTLKVEDKNRKYMKINTGGLKENNSKILIQIPKGTVLRDMDLDIEAGAIQVEGLHTKKLDLDCGAGSADLEGIVEEEADLECGMGELNFIGSLGRKSSIDCGMGSAVLTLMDKQSDFNYDLECGMGEVNVGDISIGGMGQDKKIDMGADKTMKINCGMGSVNVSFED